MPVKIDKNTKNTLKKLPFRIALYQPDIAQNVGTMFRTAACFGVGVDVIEPCGFPFDDRKFRRSAMDYMDHVEYQKHKSWSSFQEYYSVQSPKKRVILLSSKASTSYLDFAFAKGDILLLGRESAGVPEEVVSTVDDKVIIPMQEGVRSLNVAISGAIVLSEALRQCY